MFTINQSNMPDQALDMYWFFHAKYLKVNNLAIGKDLIHFEEEHYTSRWCWCGAATLTNINSCKTNRNVNLNISTYPSNFCLTFFGCLQARMQAQNKHTSLWLMFYSFQLILVFAFHITWEKISSKIFILPFKHFK